MNNLPRLAQERANYLFDSGTFEHDGYVETTKKYYNWRSLAENMVKGYWNVESSQLALIGSKEHRDIMLTCKYKDVGIGNKADVWIQIFGLEKIINTKTYLSLGVCSYIHTPNHIFLLID